MPWKVHVPTLAVHPLGLCAGPNVLVAKDPLARDMGMDALIVTATLCAIGCSPVVLVTTPPRVTVVLVVVVAPLAASAASVASNVRLSVASTTGLTKSARNEPLSSLPTTNGAAPNMS